jgi:DNA-binding GntR family transcriptional regulator
MRRGLNLTQKAYERLRADLMACRLLPGQKLNISTLSRNWGLSPGAIREALSRLTSEGLVIAEPAKGFRATPISPVDLADLTMVRIEIECLCLRRSIELGDEKWEAGVKAAYEKLCRSQYRAPNDPTRLSETSVSAHSAYHDALAGGCNSEWLMRLRRQLFDQAKRYLRLAELSPARDIPGEHKEITDAALARDLRALALMEAHLQATTEGLLASPELMSAGVASSLPDRKFQGAVADSLRGTVP